MRSELESNLPPLQVRRAGAEPHMPAVSRTVAEDSPDACRFPPFHSPWSNVRTGSELEDSLSNAGDAGLGDSVQGSRATVNCVSGQQVKSNGLCSGRRPNRKLFRQLDRKSHCWIEPGWVRRAHPHWAIADLFRYFRISGDQSAQPMTSSKEWMTIPTRPPTTVPLMRTNCRSRPSCSSRR